MSNGHCSNTALHAAAPVLTDDHVVEHPAAPSRPVGDDTFGAPCMFGEYCMDRGGTVAALLCDDALFLKVTPAARAWRR